MSDETKTAARREHCWHGVEGIVLDCNPPIYPERCCHCGVAGQWQCTLESLPIHGHGAYTSSPRIRHTVDSECPYAPPVWPETTAEVSFIPLCAICGNQLIMATEEPKDERGFWRKSFLHMAYPENCPNASKRFELPRIAVEEVKSDAGSTNGA